MKQGFFRKERKGGGRGESNAKTDTRELAYSSTSEKIIANWVGVCDVYDLSPFLDEIGYKFVGGEPYNKSPSLSFPYGNMVLCPRVHFQYWK